MTEYVADDYAEIARRQKALSSPHSAPSYGIWVKTGGREGWFAEWAISADGSYRVSGAALFATEEEALAAISPDLRTLYEVRPYPAADPG